jgi:hypothetical protein
MRCLGPEVCTVQQEAFARGGYLHQSRMDYADPGASYYEERYRQRFLSDLHRRAKSLGSTLQQIVLSR